MKQDYGKLEPLDYLIILLAAIGIVTIIQWILELIFN